MLWLYKAKKGWWCFGGWLLNISPLLPDSFSVDIAFWIPRWIYTCTDLLSACLLIDFYALLCPLRLRAAANQVRLRGILDFNCYEMYRSRKLLDSGKWSSFKLFHTLKRYQGSPCLFLLCAKGLSCLLKYSGPLFFVKRCKDWNTYTMNFSPVFFSDDCIIFTQEGGQID
jgi:hypothetical protein